MNNIHIIRNIHGIVFVKIIISDRIFFKKSLYCLLYGFSFGYRYENKVIRCYRIELFQIFCTKFHNC